MEPAPAMPIPPAMDFRSAISMVLNPAERLRVAGASVVGALVSVSVT